MDLEQFENAVQSTLPAGTVIDNPGGGISTIVGYKNSNISYVRGNSTITVSLADLHKGYSAFLGQRLSSSDLKKIAPSVFDSSARPAGHSCNCTFLFRILQRLNLASEIEGRGVRGSPFSVVITDQD